MGIVPYIGALAGTCTTVAYIPQVLKIIKQGGRDLSYSMLFLYLIGNLLWLLYGILLRATAITWANSITALLVVIALVLKIKCAGTERRAE
jgi:MtN3 and saliva related transmembrane protein